MYVLNMSWFEYRRMDLGPHTHILGATSYLQQIFALLYVVNVVI